jgi:hypothetical protein
LAHGDNPDEMNPLRFLLAIALCAAPSAFAQEYKIQTQRPAKEGQRFEIMCRLQETHRTSATFGGRSSPERKTNFVAEIEALIEVLETDAKGRITRASCMISNCVRVEDHNKRELLPKRTVVQASAGKGRLQFLVNGKPVEPETKRILAEGMQLIDQTLTQEIFGADKPKRIAESWEVNPEYFASLLQAQGLSIASQDIQGRTTLEQVVRVAGVDCLELASKVYLKKVMPPLPPEAQVQVKQAFGALRLTAKFPLDTTMPALEEVMEFDGTFIAQANAGPNAGVTTKTLWTSKRTLQRKWLQ